MSGNVPQTIILLLALCGWIFSSFPLLRYIIHWSEGSFRWQLVPWLLLMVASIFLIKMCLYGLLGWPVPGSWGSRVFFPVLLFSAYLLPFAKEWLRTSFKKK